MPAQPRTRSSPTRQVEGSGIGSEVEDGRFREKAVSVFSDENGGRRCDRYDKVGMPFGQMLLQVSSHRLLHFGVGIPRNVDRSLIEIDRTTHLLDQLRLKSQGLESGRRRPPKGMDNENTLWFRRRGVGREVEVSHRSGCEEHNQLRASHRSGLTQL